MSAQFKFFFDSNSCEQIKDPREYFFNMVSTSLLQETKYYSSSDAKRDDLIKVMTEISASTPEFILQVALYTRHRMYIRTATNFILAFCVCNKNTKAFCEKYFNSIILIPGDLIEVCQFVQVIKMLENGITIGGQQDVRKKMQFPKVLQKLIRQKFKEFTLYQLGKQCSDANRKAILRQYKEFLKPELKEEKRNKRVMKILKLKREVEGNFDLEIIIKKKVLKQTGKRKLNQRAHQYQGEQHQTIENVNVFDIKFVTMKDIVQMCHIPEPQEVVLSIVGKKYPQNEEEYQKIFKTGVFDESRAGKRMKVPIPITWERELSLKGSSSQVWENLLQNNQVPYMAMIRNLRNILKSGVPDEVHLQVIQKIKNKKFVENSKMFPLQFFNALVEVDKVQQNKQVQIEQSHGRRGGKKPVKLKTRKPKQKEIEKEEIKKEELINVNPEIAEEYKNAIEEAITIAVDKNLDTIEGTTYVFCDVSGSMQTRISGGKSYGSVSQCMDLGFILGLMIKKKCQVCKFFLFSEPHQVKTSYLEVDVDTDSLLEGMKRVQNLQPQLGGGSEQIGQCLLDLLLKPKQKVDNVVVLSDMMITQGFCENNIKMEKVVKDYIKNVNPKIKFFFIDISGYGQQVTFGSELKSKNCFQICGMSDNVLRYISLAGIVSQIDDVQNFSTAMLAKQQQKLVQQEEKKEQMIQKQEKELEKSKQQMEEEK